ncbi:HK97 gp10 family phage protein [Clostridium sp.]|uniref:HK97 gp10 family phage protein n=1 Tax=Clostridium sp. TaxID=1506 RepID=UPI002843DE17|nr:HK97 gp10 family phage protein [Clostridium sp.]MDR3595105.1 HK97 gp10 family phage protein [Clostridium sp.]
MDTEFKIDGLENIQKVLAGVANRFPEEKKKQLLKLGLMMEAEIKPLVNVDTGRLRSSINTQVVDNDSAETGTDVEYAQAVNDGHVQHQRFLPAEYMKNCPNSEGVMLSEKFIPGTHFMENGFQAFQGKAEPELERWIEEMLDKISADNQSLYNTFNK